MKTGHIVFGVASLGEPQDARELDERLGDILFNWRLKPHDDIAAQNAAQDANDDIAWVVYGDSHSRDTDDDAENGECHTSPFILFGDEEIGGDSDKERRVV